jgi:D-alanyl-D-alanine carboxypeptidase/D-alanyl-D-alanine-endopeptidase (penicillin-binding protein 4)
MLIFSSAKINLLVLDMNFFGVKIYLSVIAMCICAICPAQSISEKLNRAITGLEAEEQFRHASISMYVVETATGKVVYEKNAQMGLAPASCQKVVTSAAAFDFLGKNFIYKTSVVYTGEIKGNLLEGSIYVLGSGDPTMGSWRWPGTREKVVTDQVANALTRLGIQQVTGSVYAITTNWETNTIPDGWTWEDMGNYYGAGAAGLNWRENQYDLVLKAGSLPGQPVQVLKQQPKLPGVALKNELKTGKKGSGDNAYIYMPPYASNGFIRGTIPAGENNFIISGSFPDPEQQMIGQLKEALVNRNIRFLSKAAQVEKASEVPANTSLIYTLQSPTFDSINYWFLKKSVNLYGEAFVKTIASQKKDIGSTDSGIALIREFWSKRGIDKAALKIIDGSGLSPANRVTTNALVTVMQYAKKQSWFSSFYHALPEMNGITMKDGYIGGVRSYTGYIKSKPGMEYTFSFIVNNFEGSPGAVREKMWRVLDLMK